MFQLSSKFGYAELTEALGTLIHRNIVSYHIIHIESRTHVVETMINLEEGGRDGKSESVKKHVIDCLDFPSRASHFDTFELLT
jgi:hypothetical protein